MSSVSHAYIGTFRLIAPIRTGRYSQIWSAADDFHRRTVALKLPLPEYRNNAEQRRTIRHEYEVGRCLNNSPRCLGPTELRETKFGSCLLMRLSSGLNLREAVKRRRAWLLENFARVVRHSAEGIAQLNEIGFIHQDVKPDNFVLDEHDDVSLIDFALARRPPNAWERFFWKQRQATIQGTRSYLSPEQIRREPIDLRSDVYSFGCTLYHLVAGVQPYTGLSSNELLVKHLHAPVPNVRVDFPDATPEFAELLRAMLAKRRESRPSSVASLLPTLSTMRLTNFAAKDDAPDPQQTPAQAGPSRS